MAKKYGNTWWGERYLHSLNNIDYSNRLPRGASYANIGAVESLHFNGNQFAAKVAGSSRKPYDVRLVIPPFFADQLKLLMDKLMLHPALISRLLNRELSPEILNIAQELGLKIFPEKWTDFKMECSCPDWAVPCKHIAATIYKISREIDNNPFLVFEMHNVNLIDEIAKRGVVIDNKGAMEVPPLKSVYEQKLLREMKAQMPEFRSVDFSKISNISAPLMGILQDSPPFYDRGDFKLKYQAELERIIKRVTRADQRNAIITELDFEKFNRYNAPFFTVDENGKVLLGEDYADDGAKVSQSFVMDALLSLNPDFLLDYHPRLIALQQCCRCSLLLLQNGAVRPQILRLPHGEYIIRWQPAQMHFAVREVIENLEEIVVDKTIEALVEGRKRAIYLKNQAEWLLSYFITQLIHRFANVDKADSFMQMFFQGQALRFEGVGEGQLAGGIKSWLDRYSISQGRFRTVFIVEEDDERELFKLSVGFELRDETFAQTIALNDILSDKKYLKVRFEILKNLSMLSQIIPSLDEYINSGASQEIEYDFERFTEFLMQIIPALKLLDIKILLPRSLQTLLRPKPSLKLSKRQNNAKAFLRLDQLLDFDWQLALGDDILSQEDFSKLTKRAEGLLKYKGRFIYVSNEDIERINKAFAQTRRLSPAQLLQAALSEEYESAPITLTQEVKQLIEELTQSESEQVPSKINAQLRAYQQRGYSWMYRNLRIGFGSILADDMGLGKTLQVISLIQRLKDERALEKHKVIVVAPIGLLFNWQRELQKFAPDLSSFIYHGASRNLNDFSADILLTSYGTLRADVAKFKGRKWQLAVIDEAQNIKNSSTAASKAVRSLSAAAHIAMSGTPVENHLIEFWSIMEFVNKGYLGTAKSFQQEFARPIQEQNDMLLVERFKKVTAPFMMRRLKSDKSIISDLPDKIEENKFAQLSPMQSAIYDQTLESAMALIEGVDEQDKAALFKRQGLILQMILALKQICNHPALYLKRGDTNVEFSGKTQMLVDIVRTIVEAGEKVLIFTQFREMGTILQQIIMENIDINPLFYHGGCTVKERESMVDRFQNSHADNIFILSLKAAGTGLNLTAASHVIHFDLWWNPAVEAQATDRAYRIGQNRNVMVHRFITQGTFEERINEMIEHKRHLADMTVASGETWIGKLSNKELREIF